MQKGAVSIYVGSIYQMQVCALTKTIDLSSWLDCFRVHTERRGEISLTSAPPTTTVKFWLDFL